MSLPLVAAEGRDQLLVDDLDDLLGRAEALRDLGALGPLLHPGDQALHDPDVDVGLEEGEADLATHLVDVLLGEATAAAEAGEDAVEAVGEGVEHGAVMATGAGAASMTACTRAGTSPAVSGGRCTCADRPALVAILVAVVLVAVRDPLRPARPGRHHCATATRSSPR